MSMAIAAADSPITLGTASDLDKVLDTKLPILLYVYNGESPRADVKTELDKAAREQAGKLRVVKIDTSHAPDIAERFELGKHPLLIGVADGEVVLRRPRPWGTDVTGTVEELLKHVPAGVMPAPVLEKDVVEKKPIKVTDKSWEQDVMKSQLPVIVDFWADWCGPCKMIAPILEKLAAEFAGKVRVAKVDVDQNPALSQKYRVMSIPTLMFVKNGKIVGQQAGALPEHVLRDAVNQLLALKV
jgi:thioredoxin 1